MRGPQPYSSEDCIVIDRGGIVENKHVVHAAIVDSTGRLLLSVGNPSRMTLWRSAAKPVQALAIVETGCLELFNLDNADLALMCASHNAEDQHLTRSHTILDNIGANEDDLRCGPHPPLNAEVARAWAKRDFIPTKICNNCSGKHAGMLAGTKAIGARFEDYHSPSHPMQMRVQEVVEDLCGEEREEIRWGNDGCNLPAPATPLHILASVFATFASAADITSNSAETSSNRMKACSRVFHAMAGYPELVAGTDRFCTDLMRAYQGSLIGKVGAEGCYGVGIRESKQTCQLGATGAVGIAVKVEDGNRDMVYSATMEILDQMHIGTPGMREGLLNVYRQSVVVNTAGVATGSVHHDFQVRPTSSETI